MPESRLPLLLRLRIARLERAMERAGEKLAPLLARAEQLVPGWRSSRSAAPSTDSPEEAVRRCGDT